MDENGEHLVNDLDQRTETLTHLVDRQASVAEGVLFRMPGDCNIFNPY